MEVFVTNPTNIHLPATEDHPDGTVISLQPGINDIPDDVAKDPSVAHIAEAGASQLAQAKAGVEGRKRSDEAVAAAQQAAAEANKADVDAKTKAGADWAGRKQAAADKGQAFNEPHPDPVVQQAIALTQAPGVYPTPASTTPPPSAPAAARPAARVRPQDEHTSA